MFLYNKSIDIVGEIYLGKIPNTMVSHLIDRAQRARDRENCQTLAEYVFNKKITPL